MQTRRLFFVLLAITALSCNREHSAPPEPAGALPSILLVTLDTTRADSIGPGAEGVSTPSFDALAATGRLYRYAWSTAPETLPAHVSIMTGLYPAGHGIHENARFVSASQRLLAEELTAAGYETSAFVSGFPLDGRFGLKRGFATYDDQFGAGAVERSAKETTDRAIAHLQRRDARGPQFVWVHYYDAHHPYAPPEPYLGRYAKDLYRGEIAAMDEQLGRLVGAFRQGRPDASIIVVGDHGESLGEHGEAQHGNLLYDGAMRVPLVISAPGIAQSVSDTPVSLRRVYFTMRDWARIDRKHSLLSEEREVVAGEAMKPFLNYGWQPQTMAIDGATKAIRAGSLEVYDIRNDPKETKDLGAANLSRPLRAAIRDYPLPSAAERPAAEKLSDEERRQLASLGYVGSETTPVVRSDAPRARDMVHLFEAIDVASTLFVNQKYEEAIPVLNEILENDPGNVMTAVRLGVAHSSLGHDLAAVEAFERAARLAPESEDVRYYRALHDVRAGNWQRAVTVLEKAYAETPDRLALVEALARIRELQQRPADAVALWEKVAALRTFAPEEQLRLAELAMSVGNTAVALRSMEGAQRQLGSRFRHQLELGVLLLDARRFGEARTALDRVPSSHPGYAMALFKRAQVSVLLNESDRDAWIAKARAHADGSTRPLIARERLFMH